MKRAKHQPRNGIHVIFKCIVYHTCKEEAIVSSSNDKENASPPKPDFLVCVAAPPSSCTVTDSLVTSYVSTF